MKREIRQSDIEALSAWLDGELSRPQRNRLEKRLAQEPDLARVEQEMRRIDRALDTWQVPSASPKLAERIKANIRRSDRNRLFFRIARWGAAASAAAAVLLAAVFWFPSDPSEHLTQQGPISLGQTEEPILVKLDRAQWLYERKPEDWENLTPDQRDQHRRLYLYLHADEQERKRLQEHYDDLVELTGQQQREYNKRRHWLMQVDRLLAEEQKQELRKMTPEERERRLLEYRDRFVEEGKITLLETDQEGDSTPQP